MRAAFVGCAGGGGSFHGVASHAGGTLSLRVGHAHDLLRRSHAAASAGFRRASRRCRASMAGAGGGRKVALVSGSTDGIGLHTAGNLAKLGYAVLMHGRQQARVQAAVEKVRQLSSAGDGGVEGYLADFASLEGVKTLAREVGERHARIDVLINNAGVFETTRRTSDDGYELTFAVNVLAPFVLTAMLLPQLRASPSARIINVASISHQDGGGGRRGGEFDFDNLQYDHNYDEHGAYGLSKLSVIAFTYQLAERLRGTNVTVNTCDPGTVNTKMLLEGWGHCGIPVARADEETFLATSEQLEGVSGKYFIGRRESRSARSTYDANIRAELWRRLEHMTGVKYPDARSSP